ncbi:putative serine threonine- kinase pats1, partial [Brachionus plicatilis]
MFLKVFNYVLDEKYLKSKFKDIAGFYFVSCSTGQGVEELKKALIEKTLNESYINEKIPEAWLNFEQSLKQQSSNVSILSFQDLRPFAEENGIYDSEEILQAVKFLNDLGSLQYFENKSLKDKVIINPQWIVNAFANVVSVKQKTISNGKLTHDKIKEIWRDYDESLHAWMLKLTEEFDLTFPVPEKKMSIVPCLLPDTEPNFDWPEIDVKSSIKKKQFKVNYKFEYLPIGLFNRIQVRLFQYGDSSFIWKKGSFLKKNSHVALVTQSKDTLSIQIKVQGIKPENVVFVIHETIETLINDSFNGLKYDFSFPCPDCMELQTSEPYLFSSKLLKKANEMRAQFLQCRRYFHVISVQEMMSMMPIDNTHYMEMNLEYTIRDLNNFKKSAFKYDIIFWYCDVDCNLDKDNSVNPLNAIKDLESQGLKVWSTQDPSSEKLDTVFKVIKQAKMVILGISDNFALDSKCLEIFEIVKNVYKKPYLLVEFGLLSNKEWLKNPYFASVCADFRVIMKNPKRYKSKILDLIESIEKIINNGAKKEVEVKEPDVFISYCWANSHEAIKKGSKGTSKSLGWLDPRSLVKFFADNGIHAWLDVDNLDS